MLLNVRQAAAAEPPPPWLLSRFEAGTIDEPDHHFANAGLNLKGHVPESVGNLLAPVAGLSIVQHEIVQSADRLLEHDLAIDHEDKRRFVLEAPRIETERLIGEVDLETVFAVGREVVLQPACRRREVRAAWLPRRGSPRRGTSRLSRLRSPIAFFAIIRAASTYCSTNVGETLSAEAILSKPSTATSCGRTSFATISTPTSAFTAAAYSVRLNR